MEYAALAGGGVAVKKVFGYNRDNFQYDRWLRMKKEFQLQKFKISQGKLWREDVRDLISLTEYKMHVYLLVNVLMLGFTIVLWCEGRLPTHTPDWLMTGSNLSIVGAFTFLLLSIWLAMHAAVAAQSYETRLLTQLVRLPIPTWQEVEACRTYGSEFEKVQKKQIFRVPFLMGKQETLVRIPEHPEEREDASDSQDQAPGQVHPADPWGLERRGDDIAELGCKLGSDVASLRHIALARQAMKHWQSYDAFARICMSIGVNQLLLAMSYYILCYILIEVGCRTAGTYGVILLTVMSESTARLEMSLLVWQLRTLQLCLAFGPVMSCIAAYNWASGKLVHERTSEAMIAMSFISHGLYLAFTASFCAIKESEGGTMLPTAFRSVLYLDAFGYLAKTDDGAPPGLARSSSMGAIPNIFRRTSFTNLSVSSTLPRCCAANPVTDTDGPPALRVVEHKDGNPNPHRPEDVLPTDAAQDMRNVPGAPVVEGSDGPAANEDSTFFDAAMWMPGEEDSDGWAQETKPGEEGFVTGHEHEMPRILPWRVFCTAMLIMCSAWIIAAISHALTALGVIRVFEITEPVTYQQTQNMSRARAALVETLLDPVHVDGVGATYVSRNSFRGEFPEEVPVMWPHANVRPTSLSCRQDGKVFSVTDGFLVYLAQVDEATLPESSKRPVATGKLRAIAQSWSKPAIDFREMDCPDLIGEGVQDVSFCCAQQNSTTKASCEVLALHGHGHHISKCSVQGHSDNQAEKLIGEHIGANISQAWLTQLRVSQGAVAGTVADDAGRPHTRLEKVVSLSFDPACQSKTWSTAVQSCSFVSTSQGQVVHLRRHSRMQELVPNRILREGAQPLQAESETSKIRMLTGRYMGLLGNSGQTIQVVDVTDGGSQIGQIHLPISKRVTDFCAVRDHIYLMGTGVSPTIWKLPVPWETELEN